MRYAFIAALLFAVTAPQQCSASGNASMMHYAVSAPASGVMVGVHVAPTPKSLEGDANGFASVTGIQPSIDIPHNGYYAWDTLKNIATDAGVSDDYAHGRIPFVSWACKASSDGSVGQLVSIAAGSKDSDIDAAAFAVQKLTTVDPTGRGLLMIRFMHEMNLNVDYTGTGGTANGNKCFTAGNTIAQDAVEYVNAVRHIEQRFAKDGVQNVTWVWCPAIGYVAMGLAQDNESPAQVAAFYPGDVYTDWTCADAYDKPSPGGGVAWAWSNAPQIFATIPKPMIIAETGECNENELTSSCSGQTVTQATYVSQLQTALQSGGILYPYTKAVLWFDADPGTTGFQWSFTPAGVAAYGAMMHQSFFNPTGCTASACPAPNATFQF